MRGQLAPLSLLLRDMRCQLRSFLGSDLLQGTDGDSSDFFREQVVLEPLFEFAKERFPDKIIWGKYYSHNIIIVAGNCTFIYLYLAFVVPLALLLLLPLELC
jgi:hypothetical protein